MYQLTKKQTRFLLLNGWKGILGLTLFVIGIGVFLSQLQFIDLDEHFYLDKNSPVGKGKIQYVFPTSVSINEEVIYGYEYVFYSPIGDINWVSYQAGNYYDIGEEVDIQYNLKNPEINRIKGMSNTPGGPLNFISIILILSGLILLIVNLYKGRKYLNIILRGELTQAKLVRVEDTLMEVNDQQVYKMYFKFKTANGKVYTSTVKTRETAKFRDERKEWLFYNKKNPNQSVLVDKLPGNLPNFIKKNWTTCLP